MSFEALLADLDALQKANRPAKKDAPQKEERNHLSRDALLQQMADGDADDDGTLDGEDLPEMGDKSGSDGKKKDQPKAKDEGIDEEEEEDEEEDEYLGKSFVMTEKDGSPVEAYDATQILKSFHERAVTLERQVLKALNAQATVLKSMSAEINAMKNQGQGRKTVLNIHEKPTAHFSASASPQTILAKALAAQKTGHMTSADVARVETYLHRGESIPSELASFLR